MLITEVKSVIRTDKVWAWGWAEKVFPKKAMLEGSSKYQQEAGGRKGKGRPKQGTRRGKLGAERLNGFRSSVLSGSGEWAGLRRGRK